MNLSEEYPDVFLIDDDEAIRLSTAALLESRGISVMLFDSAEDFLLRTKNTISGCVISDFEMEEELNGLDLLKQIQVRSYQLPLIFVSGSMTELDKTNAIAAGAYAVIEKPYRSEYLLETINAALNETE